jgi:ATP-binding cassette, subfamily B, bacterial
MGQISRWMNQADVATAVRALRESRGYWRLALLIILLDLVGTGLALLSPLPLKIAVDSVLDDTPLPGPLEDLLPPGWRTPGILLWVVTFLLLGIVLLMQLHALVSSMLRARAGEQITRSFRGKLFAHIQSLPLSEFDRMGTADPLYRLQHDAPSIQWIVIGGLVPYVAAMISLLATLAIILRINVELGLAAMAVLPVMVVLSRHHRRRMPPLYETLKSCESRALGTFHHVLPFIRIVKAYGQSSFENAQFSRLSASAVAFRLKVTWAEGRFGLMVNMLTAGATAAVLFIGFANIQNGELTVGALLVVMAYLGGIYGPLNSVVHFLANMQEPLSGARRCFALLDQPTEPRYKWPPVRIARAKGHLRLEDVWFRYDDSPILRGFSLVVEPGTCVGITGPTGAGKSTLFNLLLRFYEPESGRILLDETDLHSLPLGKLRNQFAIGLQESVLFEGSVADNIAYGKPGVDRRMIVEAAQAANADGFVRRLPDGYDTLVGERGVRLSGGERQRVALARAIVRDAPILLLDEPTSSVDRETERLIIQSLERMTRGRTSLIISHRESLLALCDFTVSLEHGQCRPVRGEPN